MKLCLLQRKKDGNVFSIHSLDWFGLLCYIKNTNVERDNSIVYIGKTAVIFVVIVCSTTLTNVSELFDFLKISNEFFFLFFFVLTELVAIM